MDFIERSIGKKVRFLLPSLKLKSPNRKEETTVEQVVHKFLMTFGGYTAASGNQFGYWRKEGVSDSYAENKEFTVALSTEQQILELKKFLAELAIELEEECIYVEIAGEAILISGATNHEISQR